MARPRKAPDERRDSRLPAPRLTAFELAHIESQADAAGLNVAEYVRRAVLGQRITAARPLADDRLLLELNRVGVNLNQIARALNSDRPERIELDAALAELRRLFAALGVTG